MGYKEVKYSKLSGSGNDFIIINNFYNDVDSSVIERYIPKLCSRGLSIGADGLIILEKDPSRENDFVWKFYNADGSIATMCGNGARCAARFAYINGLAPKKMRFLTKAGVINAEIMDGVNVKTQLTKPFGMILDKDVNTCGYEKASYINTGTQHLVVFEDDVENIDVYNKGKELRYSPLFQPHGVNVNFVKVIDGNTIRIRTYEKGVENETLACGTGSAAAAIICIVKNLVASPVKVLTSGNIDLYITYKEDNVYIEGEARLISNGIFTKEAYDY